MKEEEGNGHEDDEEDYGNYDSRYKTQEGDQEDDEVYEEGQKVKSKRWDQLYELVEFKIARSN